MKTSNFAATDNIRPGMTVASAVFGQADPPLRSPRARVLHWVTLLLVALVTLGVRVIPFQPLVDAAGDGNGAVFRDPDSYYHMRRAEWIAHDFPAVPYEDPYLYYPDKGVIPWVAGHDFVIATVIKAGHLLGRDTLQMEPVVSWLNPCVALLTVFLVFATGTRLFGRMVGYLAGFLLAMSTPHVQYSSLGTMDHHGVIALFFALILYLLVRAFAPGARSIWRGWLGVAIGMAHLFHPGFTSISLIFLGLLGSAFILQTWVKKCNDPDLLVRFRDVFAAATIAIFLASLTTPEGRAFEIHFWILSLFHVLLLLSGWILTSLMLLRYSSRPRRWTIATCVILIAIGIAAALQGDLAQALATGMEYTSGNYWFIKIQSESQSLRDFGVRMIVDWYTPFVPLIPVFAVYLLWRGLGRFREDPRFLLTALFGIVVLITASIQVMFGPNAAIFASLYLGAALVGGGRIIVAWLARRSAWVRERPTVALVTLLIMLAEVVAYAPIQSYAAYRRKDPQTLRPVEWDAVARVIAHHTPPTSGRFQADHVPEYSVLAHRDLGHHINYRGQRPVIINPFGVPPEIIVHTRDYARAMLATDPADALAIVDRYRARYLVVGPMPEVELGYYAELAGLPVGAASGTGVGEAAADTPFGNRLMATSGVGLPTLRLLYETPASVAWQGRKISAISVFERVPGAMLVGTTVPGSRVTGSLWLETNQGRLFQYVDQRIADEDGRFRILVPYATSAAPEGQVRPVDDWLVRTADGTFRVSVEAEAVLGAAEIAVGGENW